MKNISTFCIALLLAVSTYAQKPKDTVRIIEIHIDSQDDVLKQSIEKYVQNSFAKLHRIAFVSSGKGDWAIFVNAESVDNDRYALTWSLGQQAKCTFSPQSTHYTSPPFNCMSILSFNTISIVPLQNVFSKIDDMIRYFEEKTR